MSGFVDVWYGDFPGDQVEKDAANCLSKNELQHAETIKNKTVRQQQLASRSSLRKVLAYYLNMECKDVPVRRTEFGKPYLAEPGYFFNLSHSAERLAIAVSNIGELGLDIEQVRHRKNLPALARRCFSTEELSYWQNMNADEQVRQFYQFWTAKEALVKATGRGIALGLDQVVINPVQQDGFLQLPESVADEAHWRLIPLTIELDYCAALVIDSKKRELVVNHRFLSTLQCR
jgi:4'-phosphopantetheinyl transferase